MLGRIFSFFFILNWQIKIAYIYGIHHGILIYVYSVEWLNQANKHIYYLMYLEFLVVKTFKI